MDFSFSNTPLLIAGGVGALIIALHIITVVINNTFTKYLSYANVLLHIVFMFLLLYSGAEIEFSLLCFMISVFAYTLIYYINYEIKKHKSQNKLREDDKTPENNLNLKEFDKSQPCKKDLCENNKSQDKDLKTVFRENDVIEREVKL